MLLKSCSMLAVVICCVGLTTATANAKGLRHIDEVAVAMRNDAAGIANELRFHFRGSRHYRHLYRDAYDMYVLTNHIHEVVHTGDASHLRKDLAQADKLFHRLEDMVAKLNNEYTVYSSYDDFGHGHDFHHGHGPVMSGNYHLVRLNKSMKSLSANLHHLQEDVDAALGPVVVPYQAAPTVVPLPPRRIPGPPAIMPGAPIVPGPAALMFDIGGGSSRVAIGLRVN